MTKTKTNLALAAAALLAASGPADGEPPAPKPRWHFADGRPVRCDRLVPSREPDFRRALSCAQAIDFEAAWPVAEESCQRLWTIYQKGWRAGELDPRFGLGADDCAWVERRPCGASAARAKQVCNGLRRYVEACRAAGFALVADDPRARLEEHLRKMGEILERARATSRSGGGVDGDLPDGGAR